MARPRGRSDPAGLASLALTAVILGLVTRAYVVPPSLPSSLVLLDWAPIASAPVAIACHVDGLSLFFGGMAALVTFTALVASRHSADPLRAVGAAVAVAGLAALLGIVLAGDLVVLYLSWESLGLIGYLARRRDEPEAGRTASVGSSRLMRPNLAVSGAAPYAVAHLAGYGLLAAGLVLGRANSGSFALGALPSEPLMGVVAGLVVVAALGRLVHAWGGPWATHTQLGVLIAGLLTLSAAYLLLRALAIAGGVWTHGWSTALAACGGLLAIVASLRLSGTDVGRYLRRSIWIDAGLLLAALGIGGPLGIGAYLVQTASTVLSRSPIALRRETPDGAISRRSSEAQIASGVAFGSVAALPPLLGFVARWLLIAAALEHGFWFVALATSVAGVLCAWAGLDCASSQEPAGQEDAVAVVSASAQPASPTAPESGSAGVGEGGEIPPRATSTVGLGALVAATLPIAALSLVPSLAGRLVAPALETLASDWPNAVGTVLARGPTWPPLLLALLGPGLGFALHFGDSAGRRVSASLRQHADAVSLAIGVKATTRGRDFASAAFVALGRAGSAASDRVARLEQGPCAAATLALVAVAVVVLAS